MPPVTATHATKALANAAKFAANVLPNCNLRRLIQNGFVSSWDHTAFLRIWARGDLWGWMRPAEDPKFLQARCNQRPRRRCSENSLNQTKPREHQITMRGNPPHAMRHIFKGKFNMKRSGSGLLGRALKAGAIAAALVLSASAAHAQSRPFAGFDGAWSGNGTVSLSDGSSERLRCRAEYRVDTTGQGLKQTLRCASDSYKFDLSSNVKSEGERVSGEWSETNRNIFGSLQGTAGGGKIDVMVEAPGFSASLLLRTSGNRQTVQINSKGDIRGVSITMVKS
jgi:hypothetical protein